MMMMTVQGDNDSVCVMMTDQGDDHGVWMMMTEQGAVTECG